MHRVYFGFGVFGETRSLGIFGIIGGKRASVFEFPSAFGIPSLEIVSTFEIVAAFEIVSSAGFSIAEIIPFAEIIARFLSHVSLAIVGTAFGVAVRLLLHTVFTVEFPTLFLPVVVGNMTHFPGALGFSLFRRLACHGAALGSELRISAVEHHVFTKGTFEFAVDERDFNGRL